MRKSCLDCVRKHLAQASVLMDESHLGYPHHVWFAVGHLAEAESESLAEHQALALEIREARLKILNHNQEPDFDELILSATKAGGASYKFHPLNSKKFDYEKGNKKNA